MSNGLTSVLINVLCLSGADLAKTESQKKMLVWIAQRDQSIFGIGCVSFDIAEMYWITEHFNSQKLFMLEVIDAALQKRNWEKYEGYTPNEEWAFKTLRQFRELVDNFDILDLNETERIDIYDLNAGSSLFDKCPIHGVYLYSEGCVICNDR